MEKKDELIALLAKAEEVPFRRASLRRMEMDELLYVALHSRVEAIEEKLEKVGLLENRRGASGERTGEDVELGFPVRNIMSGPRGEAVLDGAGEEGEEGEENARNLSFPVRSIMDGARGASALD